MLALAGTLRARYTSSLATYLIRYSKNLSRFLQIQVPHLLLLVKPE